MRKCVVFGLAIVLLLVMSGVTMADGDSDVTTEIAEVSVLAVHEDEGGVTLVVSAPANPGEAPKLESPTGFAYLNYTSIVKQGETQAISAELTEDLPPGLQLFVLVEAGDGFFGTIVGEEELIKEQSTDIITNIGSGYTGLNLRGAQLVYGLKIDDITELRADTANLSVTYTISVAE